MLISYIITNTLLKDYIITTLPIEIKEKILRLNLFTCNGNFKSWDFRKCLISFSMSTWKICHKIILIIRIIIISTRMNLQSIFPHVEVISEVAFLQVKINIDSWKLLVTSDLVSYELTLVYFVRKDQGLADFQLHYLWLAHRSQVVCGVI